MHKFEVTLRANCILKLLLVCDSLRLFSSYLELAETLESIFSVYNILLAYLNDKTILFLSFLSRIALIQLLFQKSEKHQFISF